MNGFFAYLKWLFYWCLQFLRNLVTYIKLFTSCFIILGKKLKLLNLHLQNLHLPRGLCKHWFPRCVICLFTKLPATVRKTYLTTAMPEVDIIIHETHLPGESCIYLFFGNNKIEQRKKSPIAASIHLPICSSRHPRCTHGNRLTVKKADSAQKFSYVVNLPQ